VICSRKALITLIVVLLGVATGTNAQIICGYTSGIGVEQVWENWCAFACLQFVAYELGYPTWTQCEFANWFCGEYPKPYLITAAECGECWATREDARQQAGRSWNACGRMARQRHGEQPGRKWDLFLSLHHSRLQGHEEDCSAEVNVGDGSVGFYPIIQNYDVDVRGRFGRAGRWSRT